MSSVPSLSELSAIRRSAACGVALAASASMLLAGAAEAPAIAQHGAEDATASVERDHGAAAAGRRPNVLLITTDDASVSDLAYMPHTRRLLMQQGTTIMNGIAPTPLCVPARASLLTGQYAHNHGALGVMGSHGGVQSFRDRNTLPQWLQRAGYRTKFAGKYLNGYGDKHPRYVPPGWHDWRAAVGGSAYRFYGTRYNVNGALRRPGGYSTDNIADFTVAQVRGAGAKPWFMWANYVAPHHGGGREADDPPRWRYSRFDELMTTRPANKYRNHFRNLPLPTGGAMWEQDRTGNHFALRPAPQAYRRGARELRNQRLESLLSVDDAVARSVATLRRTGHLSRTWIIFTSDNGFQVGQHNRVGKLLAYDQSIRIPLIVRGPGVPKGRRITTPVTNPDIATTIAKIAGARTGRAQDGVDFRWLLGKPSKNRPVLLEGYPAEANSTRPMYTGIRWAQYTYVRSRRGEELYDRGRDPGELRNAISQVRYRAVRDRLRAWERRYRHCAGDSCPKTFTR